MSFLISNAWAAANTAAGAAPDNNAASLLLLLGFVVIFYFLLWRPQAKRNKEQRNLLANLAKGDEVVTSVWLLGKINKTTDDFVVLALSETLEVKVQKAAITSILPKGTLKTVS